MKNLKFQTGEKVIVDGKEETIQAATKNFLSGKIHYHLKVGKRSVEESQIDKLKTDSKKAPKLPAENTPLHEKYRELYDKDVPTNKKNDEDWIRSKIAEALKAKDNQKYEALAALSFEDLENLIIEKELDVDPDDYDEDGELLTAVCEELGINVPE